MTLGTIFRVQGVQGPGCISKCGKCGCAKMKNTNKIGKKSEKIGGDNVEGAVAGSRVHFQIWKVWLCKK
jgi:hypothetical protein